MNTRWVIELHKSKRRQEQHCLGKAKQQDRKARVARRGGTTSRWRTTRSSAHPGSCPPSPTPVAGSTSRTPRSASSARQPSRTTPSQRCLQLEPICIASHHLDLREHSRLSFRPRPTPQCRPRHRLAECGRSFERASSHHRVCGWSCGVVEREETPSGSIQCCPRAMRPDMPNYPSRSSSQGRQAVSSMPYFPAI